MANLTTFSYLSNNVRLIEIDSQLLFSVADVCGVRKHSNFRLSLSRHVDRSQVRNVAKRDVRDSSFPNRGMTFVTEAGVYAGPYQFAYDRNFSFERADGSWGNWVLDKRPTV